MASEVCAILVFTDWINLLYRLDYLATLLAARITSYDLLWSPFGICWQGVYTLLCLAQGVTNLF